MDGSIGETFIPSTGGAYIRARHTLAMAIAGDRSVWTRIQEAMRASGRPDTQIAVAKLLGIRQPSVSEWARGISRPTTKHFDTLAERTGFATEYLRTARGPKRPPPATAGDQQLDELLFIWAKLSGDSRNALLQHAKLMRTIQITADPARVKEVHHELQDANHRFRTTKEPDRR